MTYDAENRLVGVSGGVNAAFAYDGDGNRVKGTVNGVSTVYVNSSYEVSAGVATSYYLADGQRVALRIMSNQDGVEDGVFYFLSDHLGSTAFTLDSLGNLVGELRYSAWGETRSTSGTTPTQRRYTGQLQAEAGLYFYNARWFDPALGRFISPDSQVPDKVNPQGFDRYSYVANNPISRNDTSGHCWGIASFIRGIPTYNTTCNNLDMALTIVQSDRASASDRIVAGAYITGEFVAHGTAVVYGAITTCGLVSAACYAAITGGTAACADGDCANEAQIVSQTVQNTPKVIQQGGDQVEQIVTNLSGQWYHVFSNKIMTALGQHPILKNVFNRNDFIVQALDKTSHNGYQQWHRLYDVTVVRWLQSNTQATPDQFLIFMKGLYQNADLLKRFPDAWKLIQMGLEELQ